MRVILDCDTENEIDDQFAIAYALGSHDLDVLGVVSVHNTLASGPDCVDAYVEEARRIAELCGASDLPCLPGARTPMPTPTSPVQSEGLDFILEHARAGPVTVLATGPITDIASLALLHPDVVDRVPVVWAGAFPDKRIWTRFRLGELNARADIAAWRALYATQVPVTLLPGWPQVVRVAVNWRRYARELRALDVRVADYLAGILERYCAARPLGRMSAGPSAYKTLWDVVNVAVVRDPSWAAFDHRDLPTIDIAGIPDYWTPSRKADVLVRLEVGAILADLWSVLGSLPRNDGQTR